MITDKTFPTNKPEIIIRDSDKRSISLVGTAIPRGGNVIKKKARFFFKYKDRTIENNSCGM